MVSRLSILVAVFGFMSACTPEDSATLYVDLVTDLVPLVDFDAARLRILESSNARADVFTSDRLFGQEHDLARGIRLADVRIENAGTWIVQVELYQSGFPVLHRQVLVDVGLTNQTATVVVTRDCRRLHCPDGADSSLTACLAGQCVDPRCRPEAPDFCPPPFCSQHSDCSAISCAQAVCSGGVCFAAQDPDGCAPGSYCHPEQGCRTSPTANRDAGTDAGTDAAVPDMAVDAYTAPSCTDGIQNALETDIDCGGFGGCPTCSSYQRCQTHSDCTDGSCWRGLCMTECPESPSFGYGCGQLGEPCSTHFYCESRRCDAVFEGQPLTCTSCTDGLRTGRETDIDCGGTQCEPCGASQTCNFHGDCASGQCDRGNCAP